MSKDLEAQLEEMGGDYRAVVERLRRARDAEPDLAQRGGRGTMSAGLIGGKRGPTAVWRAGNPWVLLAASLLILLGLGVIFRLQSDNRALRQAAKRAYTVRVTDAATEYSLAYLRNDEAVKEMIRTQNADGSWKNDFLTRQNAAALKRCPSAEARVAYKKAMRNLRARGVL